MKSTIKRQTSSTLLLLFIALSGSTYAESNLPQSTQITHASNGSSEVEVIKEITIKVGENNQNSNPNLKEGEACDDKTLEPAELTPDDYEDIPMAQTIPCDNGNCENLQAATLLRDNYKKIPMAETTKLTPCLKD